MNNKVLIINLQAYNSLSSSNVRMLAMMKGLDELGFVMDLLCTPLSIVSHKNDIDDYDFLNRVRIITTAPNTTYEKIVTGANKKGSFKQKILPSLRKIYHKFSLYSASSKIAKDLTIDILPNKRYKYVISISDPKISQIALTTLLSRGLECEKAIEYWGDPLVGDITQKTIYPQYFILREERKFLSVADKVIYTSPMTLAMEQKLYPQYATKMMFVPTAYIYKKFYPDANNESYTVGYFGAYKSTIRDIMPLYNAFRQLKGEAKLYLVGDSDVYLCSTENVEVRPRGVIKDLEEKTDLYVCVLNKSGTQIPGKIYYHAASNKPVLIILDGDQQEEIYAFLSSFDRFVFCQNNENEIANTIKEIMAQNNSYTPCALLDPKAIAQKIIE